MTRACDAVLLIGFGGPEKPDDVRPFLANVLRGRPVPPERLEEVVRHYAAIGGRSPFNELTFRQADALRARLRAAGIGLPVYVGMRNWHPYLLDALTAMREAGVARAAGIMLSVFESDASTGRYRHAVAEARGALGTGAPEVTYAPSWHAHPRFVDAMADRLRTALDRIEPARRGAARIVFTAHSIPVAARVPYVAQFSETAARVAEAANVAAFTLAYQSRSGSPRGPWLEPDIGAVIRTAAAQGTRDLVVVPIGFVCDHVEVLYDLDIEAKAIADAAGVNFLRAQTANDHPAFIAMMADLVRAQLAETTA
jgi:ferrochelatase